MFSRRSFDDHSGSNPSVGSVVFYLPVLFVGVLSVVYKQVSPPLAPYFFLLVYAAGGVLHRHPTRRTDVILICPICVFSYAGKSSTGHFCDSSFLGHPHEEWSGVSHLDRVSMFFGLENMDDISWLFPTWCCLGLCCYSTHVELMLLMFACLHCWKSVCVRCTWF